MYSLACASRLVLKKYDQVQFPISRRLTAARSLQISIQLQREEIVGGQPGKHLLITGGVHGDEFEAMAALRRLIGQFQKNDQLKNSLRGRLTLIPVVNQAAYLNGDRTAPDGLDLARVCPGRSDGSETERLAAVLSELIRSVDYYMDLHSGGRPMSVLPFTGYKLHADEKVRQTQCEMARAFNLPIIWATSPELDGRTLSVARDAGVPTIYAEYLGSGLCDPAGVDAYVEGCLNVMGALNMLPRPAPLSQIEHEVIDPRPNSGHMQICNLSPITGFFDPAVQLGGRIEKGQPIGVVCDALGAESHTVISQQSGLVLVLRTYSRVHEGESLCVILEV